MTNNDTPVDVILRTAHHLGVYDSSLGKSGDLETTRRVVGKVFEYQSTLYGVLQLVRKHMARCDLSDIIDFLERRGIK